ncbi:hypothetical protein H0H93_010763 [Arthromyces matolae]|nr:hypothetical protein H0H93_010763 [Arthromyces matolae]
MAGTKFAYVRNFELPDPLLPGTFMVFRLDGHSFHRFSDKHNFIKPNDVRALQLMDHAASDVMEEYPDIVLAFGESDEYRYVYPKDDENLFVLIDELYLDLIDFFLFKQLSVTKIN